MICVPRSKASAQLEGTDKKEHYQGRAGPLGTCSPSIPWLLGTLSAAISKKYSVTWHIPECGLEPPSPMHWQRKGWATQLLKMAVSAFLPQRVHTDIPAIVEEGPALLHSVAAAPWGSPGLQELRPGLLHSTHSSQKPSCAGAASPPGRGRSVLPAPTGVGDRHVMGMSPPREA